MIQMKIPSPHASLISKYFVQDVLYILDYHQNNIPFVAGE